MGYAVLHYQKEKNAGSGLSKHIDRGWWEDGEWKVFIPNNADKERTELNKELIDMRDESGRILSRSERIARRIKEAGVKVKKSSVPAISIIMSASCEDMQRIEKEGRFDQWCESCLSWVRKTHGEENVVAAALHMDEKTPHIHVTVVPIVQGVSKDQIYREKKEAEEMEKAMAEGREIKKKRKYRKKNEDALRLCAADVMARARLKEYQTSYAEAVEPYGLERGIDGSIARHIDINDWYKELFREAKKEVKKKIDKELEAMDIELEKEKKKRSKAIADLRKEEESCRKNVNNLRKEEERRQKSVGDLRKEEERLKPIVQEAESLRQIVELPLPPTPPVNSPDDVWKKYYDGIATPPPYILVRDHITVTRSVDTSGGMEITATLWDGQRHTKPLPYFLRDHLLNKKIIDKIKAAAYVFYNDIRNAIARSRLREILGISNTEKRQDKRSQSISL